MRFYLTFIVVIFCLSSCAPKGAIKPKKGAITESVYAIGIVKSDQTYDLKMGVLSGIREYYVKEGDNVKTGQRLLINDSGTVFKAPFSGIITHIPYSVGETIAPQQEVMSLVNLKKLYLEASIEQQGALKVKKGQSVQISFESFRTQVFHGLVKNVLPRNSEFVVQVEVSDLPANILPGMNADLSIEIMKNNFATLLPLAAVSNGHVLIKKGKKAEKISVVLGVSDAEFVEIISPPLSTDDEIFLPKDSIK
ncbi:MAG: efflux RND transporter periplasmic adaptor subunit [Bacteriovorax sp.]|nr:efflux RND transporter periplasmic adaptor subunit [Bacteriovorax sp.]